MSIQRMRPIATLGATIGLGLGLLVGMPAGQAAPDRPQPAASKLFVQDAQAATAERKRGKRWTITLTGVNADTLWFADRPERDAGRQTTASFVRDWAEYGFATVPPNAVIQHEDADAITVELRNPRYNRKTATLTYTALIDPGSGQRLSRSMSNVSVFIDDAGSSAPVVSQALIQLQGIPPEGRITVYLSEPNGETNPNYAAFILGSTSLTGTLLDWESPTGGVTVEEFMVSPTSITILAGDTDGAGSDGTLILRLPLVTGVGVTDIALSYDGPPETVVTAAVGDGQSQSLGDSVRTIFTISP